MPKIITEDMIEKAAIELLVSEYAPLYSRLDCYTEKPETLPDGTGRDYKKQVALPKVLLESLLRLNPEIPEEVVRLTADELCRNAHGDPLEDNYHRYQKIRNGIPVKFKKDGRETHGLIRLIDFNTPENNRFIVASQMWIRGEVHWRRPDLIIFVNGLPLVFIELKNSNINVKNAYDVNLNNYRQDIPWLFNYNQICVLSNGMETRLGSFSAGYEHFFEWLKLSDEKESPNRKAIQDDCVSLEYFIRGLCKPDILLDYIENFILFDQRKGGIVKSKIIAKNHQFLGVNNAFASFENRKELEGKLGVFWHTQGSGKSYSMVMLARKIKHKCAGNFTFLIVTDREDLDTQIYKTFLRSGFISAEEKVQPASGVALREELAGNKGVLFTLIHKFRYDKDKKYPLLHDGKGKEIIVFVDEAHRTQYKDLAENMRNGLPHAHYIAFTGTPLLGSKRLTNSWFGDYVSEYNFAESIKDNATVPLYYVKRVPEVVLGNDFLNDDFTEILESENLTEAEQKRLKNHYSQELEVIKRDDVLEAVAQHIVYHFPRRGFRGKGMVIAVDKFTAVKLYDKVSFYWREEIKKLNAAINTIVGNDEIRNEFKVLANTVDSLYESLRPDIFKMDFDPRYKDAILYLCGVIEGKIRPDKLEETKERINVLLDQSVMVAEEARAYTINESGKEIDISKMDVDELREMFKRKKNKNLEISNLREHIEKKIEQMLRRNVTRSDFAERFRNIIDAYNAGGSQNDDFYEKILKFMEELCAEEERHIKEELSEDELEMFDLLRKDELTKDEEKRVKLAAKELYTTLLTRKTELFVVGWQSDPQPKERVRSAIVNCLNAVLPDCYARDIFAAKSNLIYHHIVDQAMMGYMWVA